jgi:glycosyltransferase involved in cell wall biosynthesis
VTRETERPIVLIGPMSEDPTESVSGVNRAFMAGLEDRYQFLTLVATRKHGNTRQAKLTFFNGFYFIQQLYRWLAHLMFRRPDLAHYAISHGWAMEKGLLLMKLARLFGVRTVGHLHSGGFPDHWKSLPRWRRNFAEREFDKLDGMVLASEWWKGEIVKHVPFPAERLRVVNNPINYSFEAEALEFPARREPMIVLGIGIMGRAKGVMEIVEAAGEVSRKAPLDLRLAGAEREPGILKTVQETVAEKSLQDVVTVTPSISDEEKQELFRQSSILLLPSHYENFPIVVLEAAAAGMAIISTRVGAVPEFFEDGVSALFVDIGDSRQLAEAIYSLVSNPDECVRLGEAAREVFRARLARDAIMASLDTVYSDVLQDAE